MKEPGLITLKTAREDLICYRWLVGSLLKKITYDEGKYDILIYGLIQVCLDILGPELDWLCYPIVATTEK